MLNSIIVIFSHLGLVNNCWINLPMNYFNNPNPNNRECTSPSNDARLQADCAATRQSSPWSIYYAIAIVSNSETLGISSNATSDLINMEAAAGFSLTHRLTHMHTYSCCIIALDGLSSGSVCIGSVKTRCTQLYIKVGCAAIRSRLHAMLCSVHPPLAHPRHIHPGV
jgi:hypothetical protein